MLSSSHPGGDTPEITGAERFRPAYHFTPRRNWMNDPNGLVYFDGEYHLYFQYNPQDKVWGNMCWGHAVSEDLLHWRELPIAIPQTDLMIFSGSIVVDWHNQSGLGDGHAPPLLAFFTAFDAQCDIQSQHLAYSHDRGRSFTHYAGNPLIDLHAADFRDPKVFYHEQSQAWIMAVVLARSHVVQFYRSDNLRDWTMAGQFGGKGSSAGQWECPDLILVRVAERPDVARWVLKVDVDTGLVDGGSGAQYFVGDFDGFRFSIDPEFGDPQGALVDLGPDFYAAVSWADLPAANPDPLWIGWQSNHQSGKIYPTDPWRGAMSLPRALYLFAEQGRLRLGQKPIDVVSQTFGSAVALLPCPLDAGAHVVLEVPGDAFKQKLILLDNEDGQVAISFEDDDGPLLIAQVGFPDDLLKFTRQASQLCPSEQFAHVTSTRLPGSGSVDLEWYFDGSLLEIFVAGGRRVYSACLFPTGQVVVRVTTEAGYARVEKFEGWPIGRTIGCQPDPPQ